MHKQKAWLAVYMPNSLYITKICHIKAYLNEYLKCIDATKFKLWYDRLGHLGSVMMYCIIN